MASINSVNFHEVKLENISKIESFLNDSAYKEVIENSETFNTRLCIERRLRMPFLDPQTGVAQYHSTLFMKATQRIPGLKDGQIYSYPTSRWRKSRRQYLLQKQHPPFPSYTHRPFGHLQSTYDSENSNLDSVNTTVEPEVKDPKDDPGKDWYCDEMEMHELESFDDHDLPDSDCDFEESYSNRKKKGKSSRTGSNSGRSKSNIVEPITPRRGRGSGRGRGRKSQSVGDNPVTVKESGDYTKKNRFQALPNLISHTVSAPLTVLPEEPMMPVLVPETKVSEEPEEKIPPIKIPTTIYHNASVTQAPGSTTEKERAIPSPYCDFCLGDARENKKTFEPEELVSCSDCGRSGHPSCLQFTANMIISVRKYRWQCIECKYCTICGTSDNDDQLLFCDDCDRGYHMYCLSPPLISPPEGSWSCKLCTEEFHRK
ncbi:zinc finger protein ubi-d4 [Toxorhynchites rutilus septentrionalis]|uniref:zinc finger protein ubi-d4 n=1 Tax=Toxorhynchites rutilus septentrionalis TaxID=329112 RepID=UPI00247881FC|nr:zinc finger protein ubi-d4 [Toxorhynchites rutilus septentrionalis]XP_055625661.1 zinc finger protein ubi-d4 [Toxorhynchites rutilus septentrionalis]